MSRITTQETKKKWGRGKISIKKYTKQHIFIQINGKAPQHTKRYDASAFHQKMTFLKKEVEINIFLIFLIDSQVVNLVESMQIHEYSLLNHYDIDF